MLFALAVQDDARAQNAAWSLDKTADPTTYTTVGQIISYTYVINNNTESNGFIDSLIDDKATITDCPSGTPVPSNGTVTCSGTYTITTADITAGSVTNVAAVEGDYCGDGCYAFASAQATINFVAEPSWTLAKTANPTTYSAAGETIAYSYVLTNTGNVSISAISLTDDRIATLSCPATTLATGASMTCTGSYVTTAADVTAGSVTNTATASGTPASGTLGNVSAQATINFVAEPSWTLAKTANPTTYSAAGETVAYSYVLTNTGNVSISAISLTDDRIATLSCPATTLATGASMTCTGSYVTTAADVTAGSVTNTATASGTPASGTLGDVSAQSTITIDAQPSWTLAKTANPTTYSAAGETIAYSYVLTNTGNVPISAISLTDDRIATLSCPATTLATGASMTCTGNYVTTAADVTAGSVTNTATASGTPASGTLGDVTALATITIDAQPSWTLAKTANPTTYSAAGETIAYSYVLTNTGNVSISAISLTDDRIATLSCPATTLATGASMTCTGSYVTTAADVTAGSVTNTATASGTPASGTLGNVSAQATINFVAEPSWTLAKTANPTTYSAAGETVAYSYVLTNTGNVSISAISLTDDRIATLSCPATTLATGASMTCTGSYVTTAADVTAGSVTNTATASGTPASGTLGDVSAQATITLTVVQGSITIVENSLSGDETFGFSSTLASFDLTTSGGTASRAFSGLAAGTYVVSQTSMPFNWLLNSISCTGDSGGTATSVDLAGGSVSIELDAGEAITCTFTNSFDLQNHVTTTQTVIKQFLNHRASLLVTEEPDRPRYLRRLPGSLWDTGNPGPGNLLPFTITGDTTGPGSRMVFSTSMNQIAFASARAAAEEAAIHTSPRIDPLGFAPEAAEEVPVPANLPVTAYAPQSRLDVWIEAHYLNYDTELGSIGTSGNFGIVYLGADYLVNESLLAGALVQFDWAREKSDTLDSWIEGRGTMAGPYLSARLSPNLFFDVRAAWGTSDNRVNPFGTYEDDFSTNRWLAHAKLTGNWLVGDDVRITPSISVDYVEERQESYVDSLGITIPEQTSALGRLTFGPEIAKRYIHEDGSTSEPFVALTGAWDFVRPETNSLTGQPVSADAFHAKVQAGVLAKFANGVALRIAGSYDGIGSSSLEAYGAQAWLSIPLY